MSQMTSFPEHSRAWRVEEYRKRHTPRPARLPLCVQAEYPPPAHCERVAVQAQAKGAPIYVGEGDPESKPFDINDYAHPLGEPYTIHVQVPLDPTTLVAETARLLEERGILNHAFADWPKLDSAH